MSEPLKTDDLLACAVDAARAAGLHAQSNFSRRHEVAERFAHDVKLQLDSECQRKAEQVIRRFFPGHRVLGEEGGEFEAGPAPLWIIDPIDGTVNFMHGLPFWCSSVAVRVGGEVVAGAVYLPALDECFTASSDEPAQCNGRLIRVSPTATLGESIVLTGLSKNIDENLHTLDILKAVSLRAQKARIMGAAAVDLCYVACGRADGYFESGIYLWDVAAAGFIAQKAGATVEIVERLSDVRFRYLCSNGLIHADLRGAIVQALASG